MSQVALVESDPMIRSGMRHLLQDGGLGVVAVASAGELPSEVALDAMILDIAAEGAEATSTIADQDQPVLVVAESLTDVTLTALLEAGARGLILKESVPVMLVHATVSVIAGGVFLDPQVVGRLVALMTRGQPGTGRYGLTTQERRVLGLLRGRRTNREIAAHLGISVETVKTHLRNATRKLGAYDRIDAERIVSEQGIDSL